MKMIIRKCDCFSNSRYAYQGIDKDGHDFHVEIGFGKNETLVKSLNKNLDKAHRYDKAKDYIYVNAQYTDDNGESWAYTKKADPAIMGWERYQPGYKIVKLFEHTPENVAAIIYQLTGCTIPA